MNELFMLSGGFPLRYICAVLLFHTALSKCKPELPVVLEDDKDTLLSKDKQKKTVLLWKNNNNE